MKKQIVFWIGAVVLIILAVAFASKFFGGEDAWVCENGQWIKHGSPSAQKPQTSCGSETSPEDSEKNISVSSPQKGEELSLPFSIKGQARVFENTVNFKLKDKEDNILYEGFDMAQSPDMGQFGPFEKEISYLYQKPATAEVIIEVFEFSAKDGSVINLVSLPVKLKSENVKTVKVFYLNNNLDPEVSCNKVFPVERIVSGDASLIESALKALIGEISPSDVEKGYDTALNLGIIVKKWSLEDGAARVDFNEALEQGVGGSCKVSAIRAQITETLKQFSSVKEVVISIDGRTEDILQP